MDFKRLQSIILETLSKEPKLFGTSVDHIAFTVFKQLKNNGEQVNRETVIKAIKAMSTDNVFEIRGSKNKGYSLYPSTQIKSGTLYSASGELIIDGSGKRITLQRSAYKFLDDGVYNVQFTETKSGTIALTSVTRIKGETDAGVLVDSEVRIKGYVLKNEDGRFVFYADDQKKYPNGFAITGNNSGNTNLHEQIAVAILNDFDLAKSTVTLQQTFGNIGDPIDETRAHAAEAGVRHPRSEAAQKQAEEIETSVDFSKINLVDENGNPIGKHKPGLPVYVDMRHKKFRSIDPPDCRDRDDIVCVELDEDGNYIQYSAIADVTEYIKPGSPIWNEAMRQAFTLYTPYKAFAMIPEILANGILSLNAGEDRLTICTISVIDKNTGKRIPGKDRIVHALVNSKGIHDYEEVQSKLDSYDEQAVLARIKERIKNGGSKDPQDEEESFVLMKLCSDAIWRAFGSRDILSINRDDEKRFVLDESGREVLDIERRKHIPTMSMIEAFMINSNEVLAEYMRDNKLNGVFRVHDSANAEKLEKFRAMMSALGIEYTGDGSNASLQKFMETHKDSPYIETIKGMVLRTQSKAKYSKNPFPTDPDGNDKTGAKCHSALQSECYTHFTAGIRRFADLIVQYAVKTHLRTGKQAFTEEYVAQVAALISSMEIKIEEAERKISELYCSIWAEKHIDEVYEGEIVGFNGPYAIVEHPEKGFRTHIRLDELCPGGSLDEHGVLVRDEKGAILTKLCDKVTFRIDKTSRQDRMIYGSVSLTKKLTRAEKIKAAMRSKKAGQMTEEELAALMQEASTDTINGLVEAMQTWKAGVEGSSAGTATETPKPQTKKPPTSNKGGMGPK